MNDNAAHRIGGLRPPAPRPRKRLPGWIASYFILRYSPIAALAEAHFEEFTVASDTIVGPVVLVSSPAALRHVMVTNFANYPREALQRRIIAEGLGSGLLGTDGDQWRNQRRTIAPFFVRERVAGFEEKMAVIVDRLVDAWDGLGDAAVVRLDEDIPLLSVDMIEATLFPDGLGDEKPEFPDALKNYFMSSAKLSILDVIPGRERLPRLGAFRSRHSVAMMRRIADRSIALWREGKAPPAMLEWVAGEGRKMATAPLTEVEVRDNVITLLGAGSETTAGTICWALYLLAMDAEWRRRVEEEVDRAMPDGRYVPGSHHGLVATKAVVEETLRLYPVVPVTARQAMEADMIDGHPVVAGTIVLVAPYVVQRHRKLWHEPDIFDPSRFLPGARDKIERFAYFPFGAGPRVCLGQGFAIQEMVIAVAAIIRRFRLEPTPGFSIWPIHRATLRPEGILPMILRRRT
jgi:cytochrome P450